MPAKTQNGHAAIDDDEMENSLVALFNKLVRDIDGKKLKQM